MTLPNPRSLLLAVLLVGIAAPACIDQKASPKVAEPEKPAVDEAQAPEKKEDPADKAKAALQSKLQKAFEAKGPKYKPRTEHFNKDGSPKYLNRLILENSPYLLQHAHNPVDWRPWGDEAFEAARKMGRPVLLSVGYATCHWCHVMERESFEDEEIAAYINKHYIAIKVDRERRPDVDSIYMKAVRLMTGGSGGWPMTVVMTPERQPFFGGTYFPARTGDRGSRKGFFTILQELRDEYASTSTKIIERAADMSQRIERMSRPARPAAIPGAHALVGGAARFGERFDPQHGGFGRRPKFPRPVTMALLLQVHRRTGDPEALRMVTTTLRKMSEGGVYDHVGGGFHRYSVDQRWLVPHFEKMLYDNAQLASIYLDAWQITDDANFVRVTREILDYVGREMTDGNGAFYSATDADSVGPSGEQEEGYYFSWTPAELRAVLTPEEASAVEAWYGVTPRGNFEHGRTILHTWRPRENAARAANMSPEALTAAVSSARGKLYKARALRAPPLTDDKVLVGWNGLMISAFARAGLALAEPDYTARAVRAGQFLWSRMWRGGALSRVYKDGHISHRGMLEDYAFFAAAALDLFEATGDSVWLTRAADLHKALETGFWDSKDGGYYLAHVDTKDLMVREKPTYDGAVPTGNAVALRNLLRLYEWTGDVRYKAQAEKGFSAFGRVLGAGVTTAPLMAAALDFYLDSPKQIVLVKPNAEADASAFEKALGSAYLPNRVLVRMVDGDVRRAALEKRVPLAEGKIAKGGKVTAYVCEASVCKRPTSDPKVFAKQIAETKPYEGGPFDKITPR